LPAFALRLRLAGRGVPPQAPPLPPAAPPAPAGRGLAWGRSAPAGQRRFPPLLVPGGPKRFGPALGFRPLGGCAGAVPRAGAAGLPGVAPARARFAGARAAGYPPP